MSLPLIVTAALRYAVLTLRLNFRSPQALVYGYLVPVFFLLAFGSIFGSENPRLLGEMGQVLTITILGGACFGLPTALVAERERGVWRRYRLLPVQTEALLIGAFLARVVIVALAAVLQIVLARLVFGTPWPAHPEQLALAVLFLCFAFLGLGLLIAALADDVPAVQALGQCLFLPMIIVGGVGVPLAALPFWAQRLAGFMPGRYAVEVLQPCFGDPQGLLHAGFSLAALAAIGAAAGLAGTLLFRWDNDRQLGPQRRFWIAFALGSWIAVGLFANVTGRIRPVLPPGYAWQQITDGQIAAITYDNLPADSELVTRLAPRLLDLGGSARLESVAERLKQWAPGRLENAGQSVRNLVCVATIADIGQDLQEAEIARLVFEQLKSDFDRDQLRRALAWIALAPESGTVIGTAPEFGLRRQFDDSTVRSRSVLYAVKFLGKIEGKLQD